jgi:hypothetical protein
MKKLLLTILAFVSVQAQAVTSDLIPANMAINGFIYNTTCADKDWQNDRTVGALNLDYFTGNFAARTQLSTYSDQHIRRAVLEYSHPIGSNVEMVYQVGRFTRLESFYEGITDNPGNYKQALLPMSGYSYRMFNGAFVIMDGYQGQATFKLPNDYLLKARYSAGKMTIPNQPDIQREAFRQVVPNLSIDSTDANYDWALALESIKYKWYISRNRYHMDVNSATTTGLSNTVSNNFNQIDYKVDKAGVRYDDQSYVGQLEWLHDITEIVNKSRSRVTSNNNAVGYNYLVGKYIGDQWLAYAGRSYGRNKVAKSNNQDNYLGVTWSKGAWTVSGEYHWGHGFAWRKYDAPFVAAPNIPEWKSVVASVTYRF